MTASSSAAILLALAATCATAVAAPTESVGGDSGSMAVSPAVVATWFATHAGDAPSELQLLVLWRGAPGWLVKPEKEGSSKSQAGSSHASGGRAPERATQRLEMAGVVLEVELDIAKRHARVGPHEIELGESNVVLIDGVDEEAGFRLAGLLRVDPAFPSSPDLAPVLARSAEVVAFLRCETSLEDPAMDALIHATCGRLGREAAH
ncbi:MAG TPA: hypothetical protein VGO79_06050 [Thermoanaerobaculia bacterium]